MIKTLSAIVLAVAVAVFVVLPLGAALSPGVAHADDAHVEWLKPGVDGGTSATSTALFPPSSQIMLDCDRDVRYRSCVADAGVVCPADGTSSRIIPDKQTDVCLQQKHNKVTVYRAHDGGAATCGLYFVYPKTICP